MHNSSKENKENPSHIQNVQHNSNDSKKIRKIENEFSTMLIRMERMEARMDEISLESSLKDERMNMLFNQNSELHRKLERTLQSFKSYSNMQMDKNALQSANVNQIPSHRDHKEREREREKPLTDRVKISQTTNNPFQ